METKYNQKLKLALDRLKASLEELSAEELDRILSKHDKASHFAVLENLLMGEEHKVDLGGSIMRVTLGGTRKAP